MELTIPLPSYQRRENHEWFSLNNDSLFKNHPILTLNEDLDNLTLPHGVNEKTIEYFLKNLEAYDTIRAPAYWLALARLFELSLVCAGHYADNCEFSAAGDLLVNPRKILIHRRGCPFPSVKHRHGRLSEQLNQNNKPRELFLLQVKHEVLVEIASPPILPYLFEQLEQSGQIASWYLNDAQERMKKISDTIGFLSTWSVSSFEDLRQRLQTASPKTCRFVNDHLCRFDTRYFEQFALEILKITENCNEKCEFLVN